MSTSIAWTEETWNPVRGCSMAPGSEDGGCLNCYAARMAARNLPELKSPTTGQPFAILHNTGRTKNGRPERVPRWTGVVEFIPDALSKPMHWKRPRRVFVNSMSDLFHENLPEADILSVFQVMGKCPAHTFQILTKRQRRLLDILRGRYWRNLGHSPAMGGDHYVLLEKGAKPRPGDLEFLPNVDLGVSIENEKTARLRIADLLNTPAARRFVSFEPALGPVDLASVLKVSCPRCGLLQIPSRDQFCQGCADILVGRRRLDWVIIGGESGPRARPFNLAWLRFVISQCKAAGVPIFVKQLGARPISDSVMDQIWLEKLTDLKGENINEWPPDVRIRQYPEPWRLAA